MLSVVMLYALVYGEKLSEKYPYRTRVCCAKLSLTRHRNEGEHLKWESDDTMDGSSFLN